jgi:hypothetical protein
LTFLKSGCSIGKIKKYKKEDFMEGNKIKVQEDTKGLTRHITVDIKTEAGNKKYFSIWIGFEKIKTEDICTRCLKIHEEAFLDKYKLTVVCIRSQDDKKSIGRDSEFFTPVLEELKQTINGELCEKCYCEKKVKKSKK